MKFIAHRINTLAEISSLPENVGVEFDVRDNGGCCVIAHDPYIGVLDCDEYLGKIGNRFLIVNIK